MNNRLPTSAALALVITLAAPVLQAQPGPPSAPPPPEGRNGAPIDLTGTWVSIVSEDWRWRMATPLIGDFANIPENAAAREAAMAWTPESDAGNECVAYGAPAIMHEPGRINISWQDDMTLQLDFDAGMQQRTFHFDDSVSAGDRSRQGHSSAHWKRPMPRPPGLALGVSGRGNTSPKALVVETDNLTEGYLRKNGIPHSEDAKVTEYFNVIEIADGSTWMFVTIIVEDPAYLTEPWVTSMNFKKEADDSNFDPTPCFVVWED